MRNPDRQMWLERIVKALEELKEGGHMHAVVERAFPSRSGSEQSSTSMKGK